MIILQMAIGQPFIPILETRLCGAGQCKTAGPNIYIVERWSIGRLEEWVSKEEIFLSEINRPSETGEEIGKRLVTQPADFVSIHKRPICAISALRPKFYPRNISPMSAAKFFARLDLDPSRLFADEHY